VKRTLALVAVSLFCLTTTGAHAAPVGPAETGRFYNILPPGEAGSVNAVQGVQFEAQGTVPEHFADQLGMYANLVYNSPGLADADITRYFKPEVFTVALSDVTRTETPKSGLTIVRDKYDVAHVYGNNASDVFFGAGYAQAEDRLFTMDVLRHVGRARMAEFLGASDANLAMDRDIATVAGYNEQELQMQYDLLPSKFGATGVLTQLAISNYVEGINKWIVDALTDPTKLPAEYPALQLVPTPWAVTDVVSVATLIQATFAAGGGNELSNARLQQALDGRYPHAQAERIYRDLLNREDPDAPLTTSRSFPYQTPAAVDPRSVAIPDAGSFRGHNPLTTLKDSLRAAGIPVPSAMSNFIAVTREHSADHHPIAVMGPQTGYYSPNLLTEIDMHGGGVDARGATFAGLGMFVLLGRGLDFAWSATSGESDMVDIRVEKLCNQDGSAPTADSTSYVVYGVCTPMYERTDRYASKPTAGGIAEPEIITQQIERTAHGPVIGRATVDGAPVAVSLQRSTFFGEADSSPSFVLLNTNQVHDAESFQNAMALETGSFNWLYVDSRDVSYYHSGLYPIRARGVSNELPTWGTGEWEWQGWVTAEDHPHDTNPEEGFIASWNNKPARNWRAADGNYGYGPIHRVLSLQERVDALVEGHAPIHVTDMVDAMEGAATVDLRGSQVVPDALRILGADPDTDAYTSLMRDWTDAGAHHRALAADKPYEQQAAVALMEAWWEPMIHATFDPQLGGLYGAVPMGFDDGNRRNHIGSSYQDGYEGYLRKAFRARLGTHVGAPFTELACGTSAEDCRARLKVSLLDTVAALQQKFGGGPERWTYDKGSESIRFVPVGLVSVPAIDWQNRPTFQQVVEVFERR
jgi:acyl-homoserine lactone acylase PvdQ